MKGLLLVMLVLMTAGPLWAKEPAETDYLRQGREHFAAGNYKQAAGAFERAVRLNPASAEGLQGVGMSCLRLGATDVMVNPEMLERAAAAFTKALAVNPQLAEVRYNLGLTCLALHDREGAVRELEILKGADKGLAQALSARIREYKPPRKFRAVGGPGERQQAARKGGAPVTPQAPARVSGTVEVYGADWCPHCRKAVAYMASKGISYVYYNIDEDAAAKRAYEAYGAGGIPLIVIGGKKRMNGFSPESLEYHLARSR